MKSKIKKVLGVLNVGFLKVLLEGGTAFIISSEELFENKVWETLV